MIALGRATQALECAVRPHLAGYQLGTTEFAVLEVLLHKGPLLLGDVRDRILVTGASTTYIVKKLEKRGLIRRRPGTQDQRMVFAELTTKGRALISDVFPEHVKLLERITSTLSVSEKGEVAKALRRLSRHARSTTGEQRLTDDD